MLVSVSLISYPPAKRRWAFGRMGLDRPDLRSTPGLGFRRMIGTAQGRSLAWKPDFLRWGLIACWDNEEHLDEFLAKSPIATRWRDNASEVWTMRMVPIKSVGEWGGSNPFTATEDTPEDGPCAVITRATLRARHAKSFHGAVPAIDLDLARAHGLISSVGFGESPVVHQGTLTLWESQASMREFAYGTAAHREAMRRRTDERWYSEELFARFRPVSSEGTWGGVDPLAGLTTPT